MLCRDVPAGAFILGGAAREEPWLRYGDGARFYSWTHDGYVAVDPAAAPAPSEQVHVLTPRSLVATLRAGWKPSPPRIPSATGETSGD